KSSTVQLVSAALPLLVTVMVKVLTAPVQVPSGCTEQTVASHVFATVSPGVRHWNVAESNAVALTVVVPTLQAQVSVAVSASPAARELLHAFEMSGTTGAAPPTVTVPTVIPLALIPAFDSLIAQLFRSAVPVFCTL